MVPVMIAHLGLVSVGQFPWEELGKCLVLCSEGPGQKWAQQVMSPYWAVMVPACLSEL